MDKNNRKARRRDEITRIVAEMHGVSMRYVNMVRSGERTNLEIEASLVEFNEGFKVLKEHVESLIPIKPQPEKYGR